ncbi:crossover junction endodeoxyribonuclease RuvC [Falsiporphyromonas endometrii]|uniref:Crossover junction endodeoxyribonuclease RuvC n=1 Tax=Falsiporphyromonas endometrii TaxID=1387297 RepID=A0ABV9K5V1_9PORP
MKSDSLGVNKSRERIILGIDPGTIVMGYGILRCVGQKAEMVTMGVLKLNKYDNHYIRLKRIFDRVINLIDTYLPDELAIEAPFFGKNVQSMLKLGRAQGVAMVAALQRDIPITEYVPMRIKEAITGNGHASKEQVAAMVQRHLKIPQENMFKELDATDGMAAALCHFFLSSNPLQKEISASKSWADFVKSNPDRIKK